MTKIQEIFAKFYSLYLQSYRPSAGQIKATGAIIRCKTESLGANAHECDDCGYVAIHYNSCRNRHCPSCGAVDKAIWIDQRGSEVLDAPYFHVVFTVPQELHSVIYQNQTMLYGLMYKAVAQTLFKLCADRRHLGAQPGFFSILHTWGQDLHYHPHIHVVMLAGGLTRSLQWQNSKRDFFIPVKVLARVFRGKFLDYLKQYYRKNQLQFYGDAVALQLPSQFQSLIDQCYLKDWYIYTKRPFAGPQAVVQYLGRYTHRIAISNQRISSIFDDKVTIKVRDKNEPTKFRDMSLSGVEFIRRFLMHILPKGFVKVRYYGIMANRNKKTKLALCRKLTGSPLRPSRFAGHTRLEIVCMILGRDISLCPVCHQGRLVPFGSSNQYTFP